MKPVATDIYRCPYTGEELILEVKEKSGSEVISGVLKTNTRQYEIRDGIPQLISDSDEHLGEDEKREYAYYQSSSRTYDSIMDWLFESFYEDENLIRENMIDLLELKPGNTMLETGCGTCRDSTRIARRIGPDGKFFLQDLSPHMLAIGRDRMQTLAADHPLPQSEFFIGNATRLPFPDGYFDAAFHFGGLNLFSDRKQALSEMARVVRPGGKVVVGDESVGPWLRQTEYGKILLNSNALYRHEVPVDLVPEIAREVCVRWIIGQAFYLIDFRVANDPPKVDLDKPILGFRGGTHRSRYYGNLEGVTPEAKKMAEAAARATGSSLHEWLDKAVRLRASNDLDLNKKV
ncbi:class I SAM-dependent methyltransferase [Bradyrhizobium sp. S69]|uniref:class I SAM-dependent methyltransferase n=1 Tax=Bradyrhizobium sp. S69 TaxID=1641856 RepID=UPI00131D8108|nr:class I SAM-dependent methyltransferase [Bradyrhizobium sp. S69]